MLNKQQLTSYISFSAVPLSVFWLILEPGIEPIIVGLYGINSIIGQGFPWNTKKYASLRNKGTVSFNFNKNCNKYEFGKDNVFFETQWSSASDSSIHAYARTPSVQAVAVVPDKANINEIQDATNYEFTDHECPQKGEILLLKNRFGNYAALKILDIKDRSRNHDIDELTVEYVINPSGITDFR
ncbi:hypothetical protein LES60_18385 [Pectobacterium brasiliense]|uniref:Uncharacterized protein n=2 Tax=Pectobacterium TaxID=122277 RepID=A0ABS0S261_PECPM|nr:MULTISPECIES: hypothetical protein [Pectobacterium]GKW23093.1 hypothetical protein PEC311524_06870 [Pectobacterium carotovorum subsp. carotovorum]ACX86497.1 hypothetical protein Pecwa_0674 [Pectobacterium parmentieri WPP163]MBI0555964.1 hypothetical protein [Pectobacterium parmentieri]MBS4430952.1 hypothetical protein [Pectobacterium punjabense]MBT9186010.1 hypothetical protein [Pectobacterium punjabense]